MRHATATTPKQVRAELGEGTLLEVPTERPLDQAALIAPVLERLDRG